jgi:large conductance mechanosensitive channel
MLQEFRKFIAQGNAFDLAVGVIIAIAFGAVVTSLVNDLIMPPIGLILGGIDFTNLFIPLKALPAGVTTLKAAKDAGIPVFAYGNFIQTIINFLIVAFVIFLLVRQINKMKGAPAPAATKECPYCLSTINVKATRCPNCTSDLKKS